MRALAVVLALLAGGAQAQTVTLKRWQDMAALVDRQSKAILALQAETRALREAYDVATMYWLAQVCAANAKIPAWSASLTGIKPFAIGDHTCPAAGTQYAAPRFFGPVPVVK
jgi:hypothetical protein